MASQYLNTILLLQIPVLLSIIIMGLQTARSYPYFKWVNLGWIINLVYICLVFIFRRFQIDLQKEFWFVASADLASSYFFLLGTLSSTHFGKKIEKIRFSQRLIGFIFLIAFLIQMMGSFSSTNSIYVNLYNIPEVFLDMVALFSLAYYYKNLGGKFGQTPILFSATFFYAMIQMLNLVIIPYGINFDSSEPGKTVPLIEIIGFSSGFAAKFLILIGFSKLLINTYKQFASINHELEVKKAVSIKLSTILGRTFHEVIPVLLETQTLTDKLLFPDPEKQTDLRVTKHAKDMLETIEESLQRALTIITASIRMYHSDILDKIDEAEELPIPISKTIEIQNLNTLIQVAIMNYKATVSERNTATKHLETSTHFVTNEIKFYTQYGGNCDVLCNSVQMVQVFYNLFKNSHEACEEAGIDCQVFIKSRNIIIEAMKAGEDSELVSNIKTTTGRTKFVQIEVEDNGPGIPVELFEKVFKLGFSTKKDGGRGRGFGLEIVKEYSEQNNGVVKIESPVVKPYFSKSFGTKFIFHFQKQLR